MYITMQSEQPTQPIKLQFPLFLALWQIYLDMYRSSVN